MQFFVRICDDPRLTRSRRRRRGLRLERVWSTTRPRTARHMDDLGLIADKTERMGIGPGVLIPSLRHPIVERGGHGGVCGDGPRTGGHLVRDRVQRSSGDGYRAIAWAFMEEYINAYKGLLRGEVVEWEGARMQMLHPDGSAAPRPIEVPIIIGALGPKGLKVRARARRRPVPTLQVPDGAKDFPWASFLLWGTVMDEGEETGAERLAPPPGPAGPSPTTVPTSSPDPPRSGRSRPGTPGWRWWRKLLRRSATSRCTSSTASA